MKSDQNPNVSNSAGDPGKKTWSAPRLIDLDMRLTDGATTGTTTDDGGASFSDYLS